MCRKPRKPCPCRLNAAGHIVEDSPELRLDPKRNRRSSSGQSAAKPLSLDCAPCHLLLIGTSAPDHENLRRPDCLNNVKECTGEIRALRVARVCRMIRRSPYRPE